MKTKKPARDFWSSKPAAYVYRVDFYRFIDHYLVCFSGPISRANRGDRGPSD